MIYTINGEQPFQVLSDSFSVSPSQSGYDLYLSADGFNYSRFATVASGTTKQFTGMNNGNYYILSGNTSEVKVNWERDCGGGGGGGTAGVSSLDGQTGALTTKTIGGQSILGEGDIPVGGDDYYVDGDSINSYSGVVDEIYHKLSSGETVYVASKYDYVRYPVAKAEIYEYQEGQPGDPDYLRQEGFQIVATRFGNDGFAIRSGVLRAFRYEGRDGDGYSCGTSWDYTMSEESGGNYMIVEDLSAITAPIEGMVAFVPEHTVSETLEFVKAYFVGVESPEDYLGRFRRTSDSGETRSIYQSGSNFYWDPWTQYNGQYSFHTVTIEDGYDTTFRPYNDSENPGNSWIEFTMPDGMFFEVHNGGAGGATTAVTSETITTLIPNTFYQYNGSSWDKLDVKKKYFLNTMTDAERLALYNDIDALIASGVSVNEVYSFYGDFKSQHSYIQVPHQLEYLRDTGNQKWFTGVVTHTDNPSEIWTLQYKINSDGSGEVGMSVNYSYEAKNAKILGNGDNLKYSVTNGSIKINDTDIANYTGTTCSGNMGEVNTGSLKTYLDGGWGTQMFYNKLEIYSGDTRIGVYNNPTVSYEEFSPAVTCTDPESSQVDFDIEARYDYGKYLFTCWLSSTDNQRIANVSFTTN